jgi:hypothetical protein
VTASSSGVGKLKPPHLAVVPWIRVASLDDTTRALAADVYFGGSPPTPVEIPYSWLRPPVRIRQDNPYTVAEVSVTGGETARDSDPTAIRQWKFDATLDSVAGADAGLLAAWVIDYYDTSRPRLRDLTLRLNTRTALEIQTILSVALGTRIRITDTPTGWPTGAGELIVEGVKHQMDAELRDITWSTTPVIGDEVGEAGPWFRLGESPLDGTDKMPA